MADEESTSELQHGIPASKANSALKRPQGTSAHQDEDSDEDDSLDIGDDDDDDNDF